MRPGSEFLTQTVYSQAARVPLRLKTVHKGQDGGSTWPLDFSPNLWAIGTIKPTLLWEEEGGREPWPTRGVWIVLAPTHNWKDGDGKHQAHHAGCYKRHHHQDCTHRVCLSSVCRYRKVMGIPIRMHHAGTIQPVFWVFCDLHFLGIDEIFIASSLRKSGTSK